MKKHCFIPLIIMGIAGLGCGSSKPARFYVLSRTAETAAIAKTEPQVTIGVGPVHLPDLLDRSQIVTRLAGNEVHISELHRWAEPLAKAVPGVLADDLAARLPNAHTLTFPWNGPPELDYQVKVDIKRLDGPLEGPVVLEAEWTVIDVKTGQASASVQTDLNDTPKAKNCAEYVAAMSSLVGKLADEISAVIAKR